MQMKGTHVRKWVRWGGMNLEIGIGRGTRRCVGRMAVGSCSTAQGAWLDASGGGVGGGWQEGGARGRGYMNTCISVVIHQKVTQHCKATIHQFKKKKKVVKGSHGGGQDRVHDPIMRVSLALC